MSAAPAVVVLAAGQGSRLRAAVGDTPKWLVRVGGTPIAHFHLAALRAAPSAWSRLIAVVGYGSEAFDAAELSRLAGRRCELVFNPEHATCNNWLSLAYALDHLAAERWAAGVCVVNSDLLLPPRTLQALLEHGDAGGNVLAVDTRRALTDEAMKVVLSPDGAVVDVAKGGLRGVPAGEFVGASVLTPADLPALRRILDGFRRDPARRDEWYEAAYRIAMDDGVRFVPFEVGTDDWVEIDDERDLRAAGHIAGRYAR